MARTAAFCSVFSGCSAGHHTGCGRRAHGHMSAYARVCVCVCLHAHAFALVCVYLCARVYYVSQSCMPMTCRTCRKGWMQGCALVSISFNMGPSDSGSTLLQGAVVLDLSHVSSLVEGLSVLRCRHRRRHRHQGLSCAGCLTSLLQGVGAKL